MAPKNIIATIENIFRDLVHPHAVPTPQPTAATAAAPLAQRAELSHMYVATNDPKAFVTAGKAVGSGQCVALVKEATGAPPSSLWVEGVKVWNTTGIPYGTAIATFVGGKYPNQPTGNHAAIYLRQDKDGLHVIDQWSGHTPQERIITANTPSKKLENRAEAYSIVMSPKTH